MTSSNGKIFRGTGPLCGEFTGPGEFPAQRPVTRTLMFTLICARINDWVINREAGDLRRLLDHYDVSVMALLSCITGSNVIIVGILLAFLTNFFAVHGALSFCQWVNMVAWDVRGSWWCHGIEPFSALLALCAGNSPVTGEFPSQRPVTQNFYVFSDLRPNKPLSKQSTHWWFETPSRSLWRTCYDCGINATQHRSQSPRHRLQGSRRKPTISYFYWKYDCAWNCFWSHSLWPSDVV